MKSVPPTSTAPGPSFAHKTLKLTGVIWFLVAVVGQWLFVAYISGFYGMPTLTGDFAVWNNNTGLSGGHIVGDTTGNLFFAAHVLLAGVVSFGGALQLVPQIRAKALWFHKINGRVFLTVSMLLALGGLYLVWLRDSPSSGFDSTGITINAALIILFGAMTVHLARSGKIDSHRRWAMRTYMLVNGVWFIRVGFMAWMIFIGGPLGTTPEMNMQFFSVWAFGSYLLPLAVLELYFRASDTSGARSKFVMAGLLFLFTLIMVGGIFGAYTFMWMPLM